MQGVEIDTFELYVQEHETSTFLRKVIHSIIFNKHIHNETNHCSCAFYFSTRVFQLMNSFVVKLLFVLICLMNFLKTGWVCVCAPAHSWVGTNTGSGVYTLTPHIV